MNKRLLTKNKEFQLLENSLHLIEGTIHKGIEQEEQRRLIPLRSSYIDQYLSGSAEMHLHIGWFDKRPTGMANTVEIGRKNKWDWCIILQKFIPSCQGLVISNRFSETTYGKAKDTVLSPTAEGDKLTVLISVFQAIDDSQSDDIGVNLLPKKTEVVRLQAYDDCSSLRVQSLGSGLKVFPQLGILDHELTIFVLSKDVLKQDWETRLTSALFRDTGDNNIIKCTSQVMYEITEHNGNYGVRLLGDAEVTPDFILAIRQPDASKTVRIAACVPHGFFIDVYHVLLSPLKLEPPITIHTRDSSPPERANG